MESPVARALRPWILALASLPALAQTPVELYGTLDLTLTRDSGMASGSASADEARNVWEFSLRTSQFGLRAKPVDLEGWAAAGRLEFDLQGGTGTTLQPRARHVYFTLERGAWEFLVGQSTEVIAPLRADSINFPAENWPGDIGQRRPMLRAGWKTPLGKGRTLSLFLAGAQFTQGLEDPHTGAVLETTRVPVVQFRASLAFPFAGAQAEASLWGHTGRKGHSAHDGLPNGTVSTWSRGGSLHLPLGAGFALSTELWVGRVGDSDASATLATTHLAAADLIQSRGGWGELTFAPGRSWRCNVGGGRQLPHNLNTPDQAALPLSSWYANTFWSLAGRLELGIEVSRWESRFPGTTGSNGDWRGQIQLSYGF